MERPLWDLTRTVHWELSRSTALLSLTVQTLPIQFQQRSKHSIWFCVLQLKSKISLGKVCERSERSECKVNTRGFYLELSKHSGKTVNNTNISMANLKIKSKKNLANLRQTHLKFYLAVIGLIPECTFVSGTFEAIWIGHLYDIIVQKWRCSHSLDIFLTLFLVFRTQKWFTLEMSNLIQCLLGKETCLWSLLEGLGG